MGVPSFYRWLVRKYPKVVVKAREEATKGDDPIDYTQPNPNGFEFDNLYLDMNGIIHPCFHPDDEFEQPVTYDEVFENIFAYIDRIVHLVRPRKLLYLAIDGVAPRAKMNQQRSRRFQTAKYAEAAEEIEEKLRQQFEGEGKRLLPKGLVLDSNVITPGTEFMDKLSNALHSYITSRLINDMGWKGIKVILSDANVPGEGEHKIMSFIRMQRSLPGYDPNLRHCLYGLDADLIMLALASHEVNFSILREDVLSQEKQSRWEISSNIARKHDEECHTAVCRHFANISYQFLQVWILREYLQLDMEVVDAPHEVDFERVLDDFVFMCFVTGNDFLPHLPSLEMSERAVDLLMKVYKEKFVAMGGYLVDTHLINDQNAACIRLNTLEKFFVAVGSYEDKIFQRRSELKQHRLKKFLRERVEETLTIDNEENMVQSHEGDINFDAMWEKSQALKGRVLSIQNSEDVSKNCNISDHMMEFRSKKKELLREHSDLWKRGSWNADKVKLGTVGWKQRYYQEKFSLSEQHEIEGIRGSLIKSYLEGLYWVLHYYYAGVPSWTWYYNYYYSPFASDLKGLTRHQIKFQMGKPFKPFDQLLAVLPSSSANALPIMYQLLMTSKSNIIDFYPADFEVDMDGKRFLWQCVSKLPFIDEERLIAETKNLEKVLQEDERRRNREALDRIYVISSSDIGKNISSSYKLFTNLRKKDRKSKKYLIDGHASDGLHGYIRFEDGELSRHSSCSKAEGWQKLEQDSIICVLYELPDRHDKVPARAKDVELPEKTITEADIERTILWHEQQWGQARDNTRYQHCRRTPQKDDNGESSAQSDRSWVREIYKEGGTGWGRGRGKVSATAYSPNRNMKTDLREVRKGIYVPNHCRNSGANGNGMKGCLQYWQQKPTFPASGGRGTEPPSSRPVGWSSGRDDASSSKSNRGGRPPSLGRGRGGTYAVEHQSSGHRPIQYKS